MQLWATRDPTDLTLVRGRHLHRDLANDCSVLDPGDDVELDALDVNLNTSMRCTSCSQMTSPRVRTWHVNRSERPCGFRDMCRNGRRWLVYTSVGRTDYFTPDRIGIGTDPYNRPGLFGLTSFSGVA